MKIGTLCKVTSKVSHHPSQYGHLVVVLSGLSGSDTVVEGKNLNTGKTHHYFRSEIKEVKQ
tara:strand:- start:784 stop:966 length:183 start_codon:yes stop_codon:yes gene_type:complete